MSNLEKLMKINKVEKPKTNEEQIAELQAKLDGLITFMGVKGQWNGNVFEVIKEEMGSGDYTNPILYKQGMSVELGKWYYTESVGIDLPREAIMSGVPVNFDDNNYFDWVV